MRHRRDGLGRLHVGFLHGATMIMAERGGCRAPAMPRKRRILSAMSQPAARPLRKFRRIVIAVLLVGVLLAVGALLFIDSIAKQGISLAGTHVLGVPTSVREVSIGVLSSKSTIEGLEVDNPAGFAPVKFLSVGSIEVDAPFQGLIGSVIVIDRLAIRDLTLEIEKASDGTLNVERIVENLKKSMPAQETAPPPSTESPPPTADSREAIIRELRIERIEVRLRNIAGGKDGVVPVKLPDLVLRDLSSKGGVDVLASEVSGVVIGAVMKSVIAANIEGLGSEVVGAMQGAVEGIGGFIGGPLRDAVDVGIRGASDALKGVGKGLGDIGKGLGKGIEEGAGKVLDGVGDALDGLFGGKKK